MAPFDYKGGVLRKVREQSAAWRELLRLEYQGDNLLAWFTASAVAALRHPEDFDVRWVVLGVVVLVVAQAALELLDGYHDFRQGAHGRKDGAPTWTGGSGVLAEGRVVPRHALVTAWSLGLCACALFGVLVLGRTGTAGLVIGAIGCAAGAGWAMPPFKLSYRGLGEVIVAIVAGPLMTAQAWLVTSGRLDLEAFWIGAPFGLLQFAMAMAHGIVDHDADARAGKRTLVVRAGRTFAARAHMLASFGMFASVVALVVAGLASRFSLLVLGTLPLAWISVRIVRAAARSSDGVRALACSYPPYKLLITAGLVLALSGLAQASWALSALFVVAYGPVFVLTVHRWRTS